MKPKGHRELEVPRSGEKQSKLHRRPPGGQGRRSASPSPEIWGGGRREMGKDPGIEIRNFEALAGMSGLKLGGGGVV